MTKKYKVVWANVANTDLVEIIRYIRVNNSLAATDNLKKIQNFEVALC